VALGAVVQVVRGHVADLHLVVVPLEVAELHPGVVLKDTREFILNHFYAKEFNSNVCFLRSILEKNQILMCPLVPEVWSQCSH